MIFDMTTFFSDQQAITVDAASTNVVDLGAPGTILNDAAAMARDIGKGYPIPILIRVTETFATLTSLTTSLQVSATENFSSPVTVWTSGAVVAATLVAGYTIPCEYVPRYTNLRYLRVYYDVTGSDATAGKISAGITMGNQSNG